jgi:predicted DNA-binding transcriptional regulator YafY
VRVVEPLGLVLKAGAWYMVARSRKRHAIYRVESGHAIRVLQERRIQHRNFHLARVWEEEVSRFEASLRRALARVRVRDTAMSRVSRVGADAPEAIRAAKPDAEGWRTHPSGSRAHSTPPASYSASTARLRCCRQKLYVESWRCGRGG